MKTAPRVVWNVNLLLIVALAVLVLAVSSVAFDSGNVSAGHPSEEIKFAAHEVLVDCGSTSATVCEAACPTGETIISGNCFQTASPEVYSGGVIIHDGIVWWQCTNRNNAIGAGSFAAFALCMPGGA